MTKLANDMRQRLLEVTGALMAQRGYTAVGLAEIVAAAGVPKGSFYYYFSSKEDFGQALLTDYFARYLAKIDDVLGHGGTGLERLMAYFQYWTQTQGGDLPSGKCMVVKLGPEVCDLSEDMRKVLEAGADAIMGRIASAVALGQADGSVTNTSCSAQLAESLYQLWLGASLLAKLKKRATPFQAALDASRRLLS